MTAAMTAAAAKAPTKAAAKAAASRTAARKNARRRQLLDEAYSVFCKLKGSGAKVDPREFAARYPAEIQGPLRNLIDVHLYCDGRLELLQIDSKTSRPGPFELLGTVVWPELGAEFAGFTVVRELGRGTFARVYEATDPAVGERHVALKLTPYFDHSQKEATALGRIAHPNVVQIYSVVCNEDDILAAVCMPYYGGVTLQHVLADIKDRAAQDSRRQRGQPSPLTASALFDLLHAVPDVPLALPDVARTGDFVDGVRWLATQLAEALAFVHARGICHRDLKPSNIVLRPDGVPVLVDFNLADAEDAEDHAAGTPVYMPPERLQAFLADAPSHKLDVRSDLYGLGVILYELLTGRYPFGPVDFNAFQKLPLKPEEQEQVRKLLDRQRQGCPPIRDFRPEVDRVFAQVVEQCLAWGPKDRPPSAAVIARALGRSRAPRARACRWVARHRIMVAAACLFLMGAGSLGTVYVATRPPARVVSAELGKEAAKKRDFRRAIVHFTDSLRADPNQPEVLCARGRAYLKLAEEDPSQYAVAGADFDQAQMLAPDNWSKGKYEAFYAYCFQKRREIDAATKLYRQALIHGFATAALYNNLAKLRMDQSNLGEAQRNLHKALEMDANLQVAHYNQAVLCFQHALNAKQASPDRVQFLRKSIAHLHRASALGPMTGLMSLTAASIHARAASINGAWAEQTLAYLADAVKQGVSPQDLAKHKCFARINTHPAFAALTRQQPPANHPRTAPIEFVEPLSE